MGDLLKEAIADAKAVRETALANAKMALEEAFTPQLKSMLSAKLKEDEFEDEEEMSYEEDDEFGGEEEIPAEEPEIAPEEGDYSEQDEFGGEEEIPAEEPEVEEEGIIEINGVKYAPVVSEEGEGTLNKEEDVPGELDLEAIVRELETELKEEDDAYDEANPPEKDGLAEEDDAYDEPASKEDKNDGKSSSTLAEQEDEEDEEVEIDESVFTEDDDEDDDEEAVEEQSDSSDIGKGDNVVDAADGSDEEDPGEGELHEIRSELKEYKEAVKFLKDKLHEVNILNAKLLFTNKLFKEYALDNNQKLKVVETFDRAQTTREIKLVYSTLAEQFGDNGSINKRNPIKESASAKSGSTKPSKESKKVITEEDNVANRFRKLAGIING